jgi:apolipoprotein N-acyltransferase
MTPGAILALIGGLAAALGHAPFHLWPVAIPGLILTIGAVAAAPSARGAFWRGWLAAAGYFAVTLHWIVEPFLVDAATHGWMAPFALFLLAGGLALFWGLAGAFAARLGPTPPTRALAFALLLSSAEILRGYIFTGFPWAMPGYIWVETPVRMTAALVGSYGLTTLTLLAAALVGSAQTSRLAAAVGVVLLAGLWVAGERLESGAVAGAPLGTVGLVHPGIPQAEKWQADKVPGHIESLIGLIAKASDTRPDMIALPESAVVYPLDAATGTLTALSGAARDATLILGINRREDGNWYNSLVSLAPGGVPTETYDKVHLVPFGEYIPFHLSILRAMAATTSNGFTPAKAVRLIDTPLGRALPLICYEGIFPGHVFRAGERADYLLLLTNDAWFGKFAGPYQHFDQARFRAIEQGLSVVRVANEGLSAVIDPRGQAADPLGLDERGAHVAPVEAGYATLFSRTGHTPLLAFLSVSLIALWIGKRRNIIAKRPTSV